MGQDPTLAICVNSVTSDEAASNTSVALKVFMKNGGIKSLTASEEAYDRRWNSTKVTWRDAAVCGRSAPSFESLPWT